MLSLSVLVTIVNVIVSECINPTCSGDQTACASITGCQWLSGDQGRCEGPSCYSASSENACAANTNCAWHSTGSSCSRPTSQECRALSEETCSVANSGCRWVAASSQCSSPTSKQCRAMSKTDCQSAGSGCSWSNGMVYDDRCTVDNEKCYNLSSTACNGKPGCKWQPGSCTYTGCSGLAENACKADNNCFYSPPRGSCRAPQSKICTNLNPTTCEETPGCHFSPGYSESYAGACEPDHVPCYSNADYSGCTASSLARGCIWNPVSQAEYCTLDRGCEGLSESDCNSNGCEYTQPQGSCIDHPQKSNCNSLSPDDCDNTEYCYLSNIVHSCSSPDSTTCEAVELVYPEEGYVCYDPYDALGIENCVYSRSGVCMPKENPCENYYSEGCSASIGCIWDGTGGSCNHFGMNEGVPAQGDDEDDSSGLQRRLRDPFNGCINNAENTACAADSPAGCSFSGGSCYASYVPCEKSGNECSQASKDAGCVWQLGNGATEGSCFSLSRAKCYKNAAGTECDASSSASYCTFQSSAGYCAVDNDLVCSKKADGTECETNSVARGCKYIANNGYCYDSLTCYKNSNGDGCDTTNGATGCTWKPATSGACKQSGTCSVNVTGDGCTDDALAAGCVWEGSAASIIKVPIFFLLVLLLFNL